MPLYGILSSAGTDSVNEDDGSSETNKPFALEAESKSRAVFLPASDTAQTSFAYCTASGARQRNPVNSAEFVSALYLGGRGVESKKTLP